MCASCIISPRCGDFLFRPKETEIVDLYDDWSTHVDIVFRHWNRDFVRNGGGRDLCRSTTSRRPIHALCLEPALTHYSHYGGSLYRVTSTVPPAGRRCMCRRSPASRTIRAAWLGDVIQVLVAWKVANWHEVPDIVGIFRHASKLHESKTAKLVR